MKSIEIADLFVARHGDDLPLTNLVLNKYAFLAQVESLRRGEGPLFDDAIEAWSYGPVEPCVYHDFKRFGRGVVSISDQRKASASLMPERAKEIVDTVVRDYGALPAFDLVNITHRDGGAWKAAYDKGANSQITVDDILASDELEFKVDRSKTLAAGIQNAREEWPNALRMLQDA